VSSIKPITIPFEKHVGLYEQWFVRNRYAYESELQAIHALIPEQGIGIEIGVGSGRFAVPLGIKIGIEPAKKMREIAQRQDIEIVNGIAETLPFCREQFDYVLMVTTVCFLDDIAASFEEVYRVLKPGGLFIIGFVDRDSPVGKAYQKRKNKSVFYKNATFYSVGEIASYLQRSGFRNFIYKQTIYQPLNQIDTIEPVTDGYGTGSFVVVSGVKPAYQ